MWAATALDLEWVAAVGLEQVAKHGEMGVGGARKRRRVAWHNAGGKVTTAVGSGRGEAAGGGAGDGGRWGRAASSGRWGEAAGGQRALKRCSREDGG
jgi:hypothetical protein